MSYTTIDRSTNYFRVKLFTGNSTDNTAITWDETDTNMQPDFLWLKQRTVADQEHHLTDSVRGASVFLESDTNNAETSASTTFDSFDANGFTVDDAARTNRGTMVAWGWLAGGTAPTQTYTVKVVSDSGNKYRFDDFGSSAVTLNLQEGGTYTFDQSDSSNSGHPLRFSTTSDGTHGGGSEYTTNVTTTGTAGSAGAKTVITVASSAPTLYYYCTQHSGMGGQANTNSTHGSSNFSGSIQSTVSANTTAGFSIVKYDGNNNGTTTTIGHGLGGVPDMYIVKSLDSTGDWQTYHHGMSSDPKTDYIQLNNSAAVADYTFWGDTAPTSSVFTVKDGNDVNENGEEFIAFCFKSIKGYSKFGSFVGTGNSNGPFIWTGFSPAFIIGKNADKDDDWFMLDNKRDTFNPVDQRLQPNSRGTESTVTSLGIDFLANGFKLKGATGQYNVSGQTTIYMAFAESPFVTSTGIPTTAK